MGFGFFQVGARRPSRMRLWSALLLALTSGAGVTPGVADPSTSDLRVRASTLWRATEALIEERNELTETIAKDEAERIAKLKTIAPREDQVSLARARLIPDMHHLYIYGAPVSFNLLIAPESARLLSARLDVTMLLSQRRQDKVADLAHRISDLQVAKAPVIQLDERIAASGQQIGDKTEAIEANLKGLRQLQYQTFGTAVDSQPFLPWPCPAENAAGNGAGQKATKFACDKAGSPYGWPISNANAFDSSGLAATAWSSAGVLLPRSVKLQQNAVRNVDRNDLRVGDLVFYTGLHHVAMYVGDNKVVHAPGYGGKVRMALIDDPGTVFSYGRPG